MLRTVLCNTILNDGNNEHLTLFKQTNILFFN